MDDKTGFVPAKFICTKSKAAHRKLKEFADGENYWFIGLTGKGWLRGGFYPLHYGFINAHKNLGNNVQGVVYNNEVYLLREVIILQNEIK